MAISASKRWTRRLLRVVLLGIGASAYTFAQFSSLSTPRDGSVLYFSTQLKEKNTAEPVYGKIFQVDSSGPQLLYSRDITNRDKACSNAYNLTDVSVSSDGGVLAVSGQCSCLNGDSFDQYNCIKINRYTTTVVANGQSRDYSGQLWLSRNGKFALRRVGANIEFGPYSCSLVDLTTAQTMTAYGSSTPFIFLDSTASATGRVLADDGTAVLMPGFGGVPGCAGLLILAGGTVQCLPMPSSQISFVDATIDASGQTILATARDSVTNRFSLRVINLGPPATDLFVADGYLPSMTDDGRQVVYLSDRTGTPQAYSIGVDGNGDRALTNEPDGLSEAILSGDGTAAYGLTRGGRLLKISVGSGNVQELIPRTAYLNLQFPSPFPYLRPSWAGLAPGKRLVLPGGGLSSSSLSAVPPLPLSLGGVSVSIQGHPAPILSVEPAGIGLLVPPDATPDNNQVLLHLEATTPSPFEAKFDVVTALPIAAPETLQTVHQDWTALVSTGNPAHPGEILHSYAFGLGPTTPAVPFGETTPQTDPLARLSQQLACLDYTDYSSPSYAKVAVEVLFAGLAPGMVAVYQVDWRLPATAGAYDHFLLGCSNWGVLVPVAHGEQ